MVEDPPEPLPGRECEPNLREQLDLVALGYQADVTRVFSMIFARELSTRSFAFIGVPEQHHPVSHHRNDAELIAKKALAAHAASLRPIVCVGETLAEHEAGRTELVLGTQLRGSLAGLSGEQMEETIVAYEPVWAIGTGKNATPQQAQDTHAFVRKQLAAMFDPTVARRVRIQYGGSVKPSNARELMSQPEVDGALVGGASLDDRGFSDIIKNSI